jgi:regulatory protein
MTARRPSKPLDQEALQRLALHYVGRYATTCAKLASYLRRKIGERGWAGAEDADIDVLVSRFSDAGYVDDAAFAEARSLALTRRGFGQRRIGQALAGAGIAPDLASSFAHDDEAAFRAAEVFARRRRIGPFAKSPSDDGARRRAFAAMVRAGHGFTLARHFSGAEVPDGDKGDPV